VVNINNRFIYIFLTCSILTSCSKPQTQDIANNFGFSKQYIQTKPFKLASYQNLKQINAPVNIYIEGDGYAWINKTRLSKDPSPNTPTVMQLAALDPAANVVYLARPCQYSPQDLTSVCDAKYWSIARYSPTVVSAMDQAITRIKQQANSTQINLIGYSGGAAIAVLVAAQRQDIASIRTVAGNLDLIAMQNYHATTPLSESLDPLKVAREIKHIPQLHFIGLKDQVVPAIVAQNFCQAAGIAAQHIIAVPKVGHSKGWAEHWLSLLEHVPRINV